ncbi:MAG: c-type cytochrome [Fuerstiella sp.]
MANHVIVPGYERFRGNQLSAVAAGKLLISELNCQSCHGSALKSALPQRQAPILTNVANRVTPEFLKQFIANPHHVKPGTAMPSLVSGENANHVVEALTHFLAADGVVTPAPVSSVSITRGNRLFHSIGCAACHGDQQASATERPSYAMPLGKLDIKYTVGSLFTFLKDPHAVRPSGRMPSLNLSDEEARDVANYLLQNVDVEPNLTFEYFEGSWQQLPDFDALSPTATGAAADFDVRTAARKEQFALRFRAFLHIATDGEYEFWLGSDDGSRLLIDGTTVIDVDDIHPHTTKNARQKLSAGVHSVIVEYFEAGGEESLKVEIKGPGINRQPLAGHVSNSEEPPEESRSFQVDAELVREGQDVFRSLGCASCHQHEKIGKNTWTAKSVPSFAELNVSKGCLSGRSQPGVPKFVLSQQQRSDIATAIISLKTNTDAATPAVMQQISDVMLTLNCYACHQRNKVGGVPREHNDLFATSIPEMGDEGRIPPHLDGIGDKLQKSWLKHVMNNGTKDRPYMATRMPKFGENNVGQLINLFVHADEQTDVDDVQFEEPKHRVIADARLMVGDQALSCIKCHYFGKHKATGIQSLDLTTMTTRLRRDWFHRYLLNPQAYRPGTRMPSAWPNNKSVVPKILHGMPSQQIEAIWMYLAAGTKAKIPSGLIAKAIELKPIDRPIIYRNFIEGLSARGIAVGYPQKAHIAWDAEQMNLGLIWHGAFIDASMHWVGRGQGYQTPLGDHVMRLTLGQPLAVLKSANEPWPTESSRETGYAFRGYALDADGQPAFRYEWNGITAVDFLEPIAGEEFASLRRTLRLTSDKSPPRLYFRVIAGNIERQADSWMIDNAIRLTFAGTKPTLRESGGQQELIVPVQFDADGVATVQYAIAW